MLHPKDLPDSLSKPKCGYLAQSFQLGISATIDWARPSCGATALNFSKAFQQRTTLCAHSHAYRRLLGGWDHKRIGDFLVVCDYFRLRGRHGNHVTVTWVEWESRTQSFDLRSDTRLTEHNLSILNKTDLI